MSSSSSPHVLIAGAGIGGLALAQTFRKKGISYEIFERDASERERRPGWVIGLHHMLDGLKAGIPDDLPPISTLSHLLPITKYQPECCFYDLEQPNQPKIGVRGDETEWIVRASRQKIVDWLGLHIPIQYGKQVVKIEEPGDKVKIHFSDGTCAEGDILVGAEGARSATRKHMLGDQDPIKPPPVAIIQGHCDMEGEEFEEQLRLGHSLYLVDMHSINNGQPMILLNMLLEAHDDGKSGKMGWALVWPDASAAKEGFWVYSATGQEQYDHVVKKSKDLPAKYRAIIERSKPESTVPALQLWSLMMESLPTGRITLLGDAAHAMTPFRGEGAFHAISDALELSDAISKVDKNDINSIKNAFDPYQDKMLRRGREAARLSAEAFAKNRDVKSADTYSAWGRPMLPLPEEEIA
ncbi:putative monooxygenase [Astrocystis sublimbata]|nr:putative monooxygenase [Astrocystis sublimbata]